ncbi:hypothetical protein VCHENC02_3592B, partial [Vibrio harveyi]
HRLMVGTLDHMNFYSSRALS